jgi:hypothetical protein
MSGEIVTVSLAVIDHSACLRQNARNFLLAMTLSMS